MQCASRRRLRRKDAFETVRSHTPGRATALTLFFCVLASVSASSAATGYDAGFVPAVPTSAFGASGMDGDDPRVEARLLIDAPGGGEGPTRVGVLFDLDPGWHLYWRNPGETGLPTRLHWSSPGIEIGPTLWPAPTAFAEADGLFVTYGYTDRVLLSSLLRLPADSEQRPGRDAGMPPDDTSVALRADLLVCQTECIPASFELSAPLSSAYVDSPTQTQIGRLFDEWQARVPPPAARLGLEVEALYSQSALRPGDAFDLALLVRGCDATQAAAAGGGEDCARTGRVRPAPRHAFMPFAEDGEVAVSLEPGPDRSESDESPAVLEFAGAVDPDLTRVAPTRLRGILALEGEDGRLIHAEVDVPLPLAPRGASVTQLGAHWRASPAGGVPGTSLGGLEAILLAFLGGLILNLMPCILPVLAIKVFAVAEMATRDRAEVLRHGAAYAGGILLSMAALAGTVIALREAGTQVGWGFQFQSPIFIAGVAIVLVAFAMNLFGAFEISPDTGRLANLGSQATGARRSFFEGLLAVVLATPCSAPFLGTAVGFAFAGTPATIFAIFLAIGAGLAAPFLLITWIPGWARWMPRSGPWMLQLRAGLGFALLATVVWLLSILGAVADRASLISLISLLLAVAFGVWLYGRVQLGGPAVLRYGAALAVIALAVAGLNSVSTDLGGRASGSEGGEADWQPWSPASVLDARASDRPVFVAFSADWCITCKVNERLVLADPDVIAAFEAQQYVLFKADWTRRDQTIRNELARHGRAGVPLYLLYRPGEEVQPLVLPELLDADALIASLTWRADPPVAATAR